MALEKIDIDTLDPAATIVVATGNAHKLTEIEAILGKVMPEVRFVLLILSFFRIFKSLDVLSAVTFMKVTQLLRNVLCVKLLQANSLK